MSEDKTVQVKELKVNTPYDDAFRTMTVDCIRLLIPMMNEVFGKQYSGNEKIILHQNEHFLSQQDGNEDKRITDSSFTIIGEEEDQYLFECQSTSDSSILIRIFEYATQIALESGEQKKERLILNIPRMAIMFLRSNDNTPDIMEVEINSDGGKLICPVKVFRISDYKLKEIFEKGLYFILPFYIFTHEKEFGSYNDNANELNKLKEEYILMMEMLDEAVAEQKISTYYRRTIIDMSKKVLENIARQYENVRKGVETVMGGQVLEHEGKRIYNEGATDQKEKVAIKLYARGDSIEEIAEIVDAPMNLVMQWTAATKQAAVQA